MGRSPTTGPRSEVLERRYIDRVLSRTGGNKTRAAEVLGIDRRTLNRMFARERAAATGRQLTDKELDALDEDKKADVGEGPRRTTERLTSWK